MSATLAGMFGWVLRASWQGAILVVLVIAAQWMIRSRLSARWRHTLWLLVVARLVLPISLPSGLSVYNYLPSKLPTVAVGRVTASTPAEPSAFPSESDPIVNMTRDSVMTKSVTTRKSTGRSGPIEFNPSHRASPLVNFRDWLGNLSLMEIAAVIWGLGVVLLTVRLTVQNARFSRGLRTATVVTDATILELLESCRIRFRLHLPVQLLETRGVKSPALYGLFRPRLLLPAGMASQFGPDELRYIFLHELAHVKRRDMAVHWLVSALQILHWFNPVLWLGFRRMAADRELACDELALAQAGDGANQPYGQTIIKLLEQNGRTAALPGLMGITENRDQITRRISMIARFKKHPTGSWAALVLLAALGCFTLTDARKSAPPAKGVARLSVEKHLLIATNVAATIWPESMEVLTINGTNGAVVPGVKLEIRSYGKFGTTNSYSTDSAGRARVALPKDRPSTVHLTAEKEGFLESYTFWMPTDGNVNVPERFVLALDPGEFVGGIVRGTDGQPAGNAKLEFYCVTSIVKPGASPWIEDDPANIRRHFNYISPVEADSNGVWHAQVETGKLKWIRASIAQAQHIPGEFEVSSRQDVMEQLRARKFVTALEPGLAITGTVLDSAGKPVTNAIVRETVTYQPHSALTDSNGRFVIDRHYPPGNVPIVVQAPGFSPERRLVAVSATSKPQMFRLQPAQTIRVRFVDRDDKPVRGVHATVAGWQNTPEETSYGRGAIKFETRSDSDGRFVWKDAPADEVRFEFYHPQYQGKNSYPIIPGPDERVIILQPALEVRGLVTDAATGAPLPEFKMTPGQESKSWPAARIFWSPMVTQGFGQPGITKFRNGNYSMRFNAPLIRGGDERADYVLRFEAEGYQASESRHFKFDAGKQEWNVRLTRDTAPKTVRDRDGRPAPGVEIFLINGSQPPAIINGRLNPYQTTDSRRLVTDRNGAFNLGEGPADRDHTVVFLHDRGWLQTSINKLKTETNVTLLPWGRIEGVLKIGSRGAVNEELSLEFPSEWTGPDSPSGPMLIYDTKTDGNGRFVFERVPPGEVLVARRGGTMPDDDPMRLGESFTLQPAATLRVNFGGKGRPVIGRIAAPAGFAKADWTYGILRIHENTIVPEPPFPEGLTQEEHQRWYNNWLKTGPGKAYQAKEELIREGIPGKIAADGSFRIDDVPAGEYRLEYQLHERPANDNDPNLELIHPEIAATVTNSFVIPAMPSGRLDAPLDLGRLSVTARPRAAVGRPAPPLEVETMDGQIFRLADQRGKFVLLGFRILPTAGNSSTIADQALQPSLQSSLDRFTKDGSLQMLGLIFDTAGPQARAKRSKDYLSDIRSTWTQASVESWDSQVRINYGVESMPTTFLIGPDGTVLAKVYDDESTSTAVALAFAKK